MTKDSQTHAGVIKPGQKHTKTLAGTGADLESHAGVIVKPGQMHTSGVIVLTDMHRESLHRRAYRRR